MIRLAAHPHFSQRAAYVPDPSGRVTTGKTLDATERNIREEISGHIDTLQEFGSDSRVNQHRQGD